MALSAYRGITRCLMNSKTKQKITVVIDNFDTAHFEELLNLFVEAGKANDGYMKEETTRDHLKQALKTATYVSVRHAETGQLIALNGLIENTHTRGEKALTHLTSAVVHHKYRGYGIARELYGLMEDPELGHKGQYMGSSGRIMLTSRNLVPAAAAGYTFCAVIPLCTATPHLNTFVDCLLGYKDYKLWETYPHHYQNVLDGKNKPLPELRRDKLPVSYSMSEFKERELRVGIDHYTMHGTFCQEEAIEAENILRDKADIGNGLTVDEINQDGFHNKKSFWTSHTLCVKDTSDRILALAMYGPAKIIRVKKMIHIAQINIIVVNEHEHRDVANELLRETLAHIRGLGYKGCITDVLVGNQFTLGLFLQAGFILMGNIHNTGIVRQVGPTHSMLLYLKF